MSSGLIRSNIIGLMEMNRDVFLTRSKPQCLISEK